MALTVTPPSHGHAQSSADPGANELKLFNVQSSVSSSHLGKSAGSQGEAAERSASLCSTFLF